MTVAVGEQTSCPGSEVGVAVPQKEHAWPQLEGPTSTSSAQPSRSVLVGSGDVVRTWSEEQGVSRGQAHVRGVERVEVVVKVVVGEQCCSPGRVVAANDLEDIVSNPFERSFSSPSPSRPSPGPFSSLVPFFLLVPLGTLELKKADTFVYLRSFCSNSEE